VAGRLLGKRAIVTDPTEYNGADIVALFREEGAEVFAESWDMTKPEMADEIVREVGHVDILIANLAYPHTYAPAHEKTDTDLEYAMQRIMYPLHRLTRAVLPQMLERQRGKIVVVGSATSLRGRKGGVAVYGAARGAQHGYMKNVAMEVAPYVNINATAQTYVDNITYWPMGYRETAEFRERMAENPAARLATGRECAQTVLFLAGPESDFFYGQIIPFAGGWNPSAWQAHIGTKARRDLLAKRAKDPKDTLKLVIVRDMWLTGFDVPSMHTMYIDKPMKGHGLMQAIARVNRVFRDKPAGLVVDYIGIAQNLKNARGQYSGSDQRQAGIDEAEGVTVLLEKFEVVKAMYHGFDHVRGLAGTPHDRLLVLAEAIEWILEKQHEAAARETSDEGKRRENRCYQDAVLALSKAFALASASDEARAVRDEVGFFQTVRAALVKSSEGAARTAADREFAIQQILDRAVVSTEIVDILAAAGITTPDISILSDEFLAEVQQLDKKNLALEALRMLLNDEIRSRSKTNVVETKRFSERLEAAIARYHTNAVSTVEVLQELIELAKEVRAARRRGEDEGLSQDEIAFYDALGENESAVQIMGNDSLKVIAHELLVSLKGSATVDWSHRESARARMRVLVKRILRKHGYPPDLQDTAVQTVLRQAEALSASWSQ
jgi:NAD(P)-dependent dehydrogenase (short-subunit alcohol dehydrogenase family)